jgi:hypothetical protein
MKQTVICACALIAIAVVAPAQLLWGDNFDNIGTIGSPPGPYNAGPVPTFGNASGGYTSATNGGWDAWYQTPAADGGISNSTFRSAPQSLDISGVGVAASGCDVVQWHAGVFPDPNNPGFYDISTFPSHPISPISGGTNGGVWEYRAWNYCPSSFPTGTSSHYFIVNDSYHADGVTLPTTWLMQVQFNHLTGRVADDQRVPLSGGACIQYDTWVEIKATFDIDNDQVNVTYNGQDVGTGALIIAAWNVGTSPRQIANLDLFSVGAASFWDDVTLTKLGTTNLFETNNPDSNADILAVQGNGIGRADSVVAQGQTVSLNYQSAIVTGGALPFDAIITAGPASPLGAPGTLATPGGQIVNIDPFAATTIWLSGTPAGFSLLHPANGANFQLMFPAPNLGLNICTAPPQTLPNAEIPAASIQYAILSPTNPDGIDLSQPVTLWIRG